MSSARTTRNTRAMMLCAVAAAGTAGVAAASASAQAPARLPVYDVQSSGATKAQADRLASALGISAQLLGENGLLTFIDQQRFGALPTKPLPAPRPNEEGSPVVAEAPDLDAIRRIKPMDPAAARSAATAALKAAGLLTGGAGEVTHSEFESVDANGVQNAKVQVDTHVSFPQTLGEYPLSGPGSKAKIVFGSDGKPTYVRYAQRRLTAGESVALLTPAAADLAAKQRYESSCPGQESLKDVRLTRKLVYYAPSLSRAGVKKIVPHYDYGASATVGGRSVQLERVLLPAVSSGAPKATLTASADGGRVTGVTKITGGAAPYTYSYSSCATTLPDAATRAGATTSYTVQRKPGSSGPVAEKLSVTVTDANGLTTVASAPVSVTSPSTGALGKLRVRAAIGNRIDVGNEWIGNSQGLPNSADNNYDFRDEMSDVATISVNWSENDVWESDFKDPALGGNDTTYADNVDLMWFQGHGNPDGFATGTTQGDGFVHRSDARWGNNDLEWLVVHSCSVLELGSGATHVWNRWKPAFKGLHLLMGYGNSSYNVDGDGNEFGDDLADDDMKLRSAWVDANEDEQPNGVIYRYMGVYGPSGEWNREDYFHGIGPVSGDITTVTGAWSYSGTV